MRPIVEEALAAFRVVVVTGQRQSGKTTLVRQVLGETGTLARLDEEAVLQAALADPAGFVSYGPTPRAFDEVQRAGDPLIRAIKAAVDTDPSPGQFLLDGSADFLTVPTISESLAGRAAFFELWPFSQGELGEGPDGFLRRALDDPASFRSGPASNLTTVDYLERLCVGGFPEVTQLPEAARNSWFRNYVRTVTQRDIKELTGARKAAQLPKVLSLLAARSAGEMVVSHVHDDVQLGSRETTEDYIGYLQMAYLVHLLPAWSRNLTTRITRHPKVYLSDTGLAAHILGRKPAALTRPDDPARGSLIETFVVNELVKQLGWSGDDIHVHHLRDRNGAEIDVVIETNDGRVVALEIKAASSVNGADAKWLTWLRDKLGDDFVHGFVLYTGERPWSMGERITAAPISYLWSVD